MCDERYSGERRTSPKAAGIIPLVRAAATVFPQRIAELVPPQSSVAAVMNSGCVVMHDIWPSLHRALHRALTDFDVHVVLARRKRGRA